MAQGRWRVVVSVVVAGFVLPAGAAGQIALGYGMDETSGTVMTGSGGAPNGSITGDVTLGVAGRTGVAGDGAYAFNQNVGSCDSQFNVTGTVSAGLTASGSDVTDGAWHQVTCARTASGEQLLVDGVVKATSSVNLGTISSTAPIYVARNPSEDDYYQGLLDDLAFTVG